MHCIHSILFLNPDTKKHLLRIGHNYIIITVDECPNISDFESKMTDYI